MPTLKQLTCQVEWSSSNIPLQEFQTTYADGFVQTYIAVPAIPTPFSIRLRSDGYVAPGLAMYVYMDGEYQCNRNRTRLRIPDENSERHNTEVNFVVRQKEEDMEDGTFRGKQWQFGELSVEPNSDNKAHESDLHNADHLGMIEVVVLRCYSHEARRPVVIEKRVLRSPPLIRRGKHMSSKAAIQTPWSFSDDQPSSDDESSSSSSSEALMGGFFDGANDPHDSTSAKPSHRTGGRWDASTPNQGPSNRWERRKSGLSGSTKPEGQQRGSSEAKQPVFSQDWDTPEIDRPRNTRKIQNYSGQSEADGKERDRLFGDAQHSPTISIGNQSNRSAGRMFSHGHASSLPPAIIINVTQTPQAPIDWVPYHPPAPAENPESNVTPSNENAKTGGWGASHPMPGAWNGSSDESMENAESWENNESHNDPHWDESRYEPEHDDLNHTGNFNAWNWDKSKNNGGYDNQNQYTEQGTTTQNQYTEQGTTTQNQYTEQGTTTQNQYIEQGANSQNQHAEQGATIPEWDGFGKDSGSGNALNSNGKVATPKWNAYPSGTNQQVSGVNPTSIAQALNSTQSQAPNDLAHNQSTQTTDWQATSQKFADPTSWQPLAEAPGDQAPGNKSPKAPLYPVVNSSLLKPIDSRPKPHWFFWKKTNEEPPKSGSITPPLGSVKPLFSVHPDIAQRTDMSHQVHVGEPAPYVHKRSSPNYIDSFESPYAVFVFHYRSKAVLEQLLNISLHESEADEKQRLLGLTKEELVEQVLRMEKSSRIEKRPEIGPSKSSSSNTVKGDGHEQGDPVISQFNIGTSQAAPAPGHTGDQNNSDTSTNPSYNWGRGHSNQGANTQTLPEAKVNTWLSGGDSRSGSGDHGNVNDGMKRNNETETPKVRNGHANTNVHIQSPHPKDNGKRPISSDWTNFGATGAWTNNNSGQNPQNNQMVPYAPQPSESWKNAAHNLHTGDDENKW